MSLSAELPAPPSQRGSRVARRLDFSTVRFQASADRQGAARANRVHRDRDGYMVLADNAGADTMLADGGDYHDGSCVTPAFQSQSVLLPPQPLNIYVLGCKSGAPIQVFADFALAMSALKEKGGDDPLIVVLPGCRWMSGEFILSGFHVDY